MFSDIFKEYSWFLKKCWKGSKQLLHNNCIKRNIFFGNWKYLSSSNKNIFSNILKDEKFLKLSTLSKLIEWLLCLSISE